MEVSGDLAKESGGLGKVLCYPIYYSSLESFFSFNPSIPSACSLYPVWVLPLLHLHAFLSLRGRLANKVCLLPHFCFYFRVYFWGCLCVRQTLSEALSP